METELRDDDYFRQMIRLMHLDGTLGFQWLVVIVDSCRIFHATGGFLSSRFRMNSLQYKFGSKFDQILCNHRSTYLIN